MSEYKKMKKVAPREGSLAAMAIQAKQPREAFAKANIHAPGLVGKMARLAYLKDAVHGGGKSSMAKAGDLRPKGSKLYQVG